MRTLALLAAALLLAAACATATDPAPDTTADTAAVPDTVAVPDTTREADTGLEADTAPAPDANSDVPLVPAEGATTYYRAGAARHVITPETDLVLGGYGFCTGGIENCRWSQGVHDDLYVTALAIEEAATGEFVVLVGLDALGVMMPDTLAIQAAFAAKVEAATGRPIPGDRLVLSGSHAHTTPDTVGLYGSTPEQTGRDEAYIAVLVDRTAQAAADAYVALEDAAVSVARGWHDNAPDVESDAVPMEPDGRLTVLAAERPDGTLIGTTTVWPCHPTVYPMANDAISGDWVGTFRHRMGERLGAGVHGHVQGPIGAVYAVKRDDCAATNPFTDGWMDPDLDDDDHDQVACVGYDVADAAVAALDEAEPLAEGPLAVRTAFFEVRILNQMYKLLSDFGMIPRDIPGPDEDRGAASFVTWARVGQLRLVTVPGEAFPRYARAIREHVAAAEAAVDPEDVVVVGLGNDWTGYLLLREQWLERPYGYHKSLSPGPGCLDAQREALDEVLPR